MGTRLAVGPRHASQLERIGHIRQDVAPGQEARTIQAGPEMSRVVAAPEVRH